MDIHNVLILINHSFILDIYIGVVDAAVNGGINKYQEAFLTGDSSNERGSKEMKDRLRNALKNQVIYSGLSFILAYLYLSPYVICESYIYS